jgi:putative endopeptidase
VDAAKTGEIVVSTPDFFSGAAALLESESPGSVEGVADAPGPRLGRTRILSSEFVSTNFDFYGTTLSGTPQNKERWKRGVAVVEAALGEAVGPDLR